MPTEEELNVDVERREFRLAIEEDALDITFKTFTELRSFVTEEIQAWNVCTNRPSQLWSVLQGAQNNLNQAHTIGHDAINGAILALANNKHRLIYSKSPRGQFLLNLCQTAPQQTESAYGYLIGSVPAQSFGNRVVLDGVLSAALFANPDFFSATLAAETSAIAVQRREIETLRQQFNIEHHDLIAETDAWKSESQKRISDLLSTNAGSFETAQQAWSEALEQANREWRDRMQELQNLYNDKLRLQEPAKYWKELENTYRNQGIGWVGVTVAAVAGLAWAAWDFVYNPPALLNSDKFTLAGFKGALIMAAGISMGVYLINLFAKLMISAFHLSRDARERYQLTCVFLALAKDKAVSDEDRKIVLTALFSRADTGLLKSDSSPAFPTPAILEMMKLRP